MNGLKRDIIYSLDASLAVAFDGNSISRTSATIIQNYNHIANYQQSHCVSAANTSLWDNAIICDQTIKLRRILFTNLIDLYTFNGQYMKVAPINSLNDLVDPNITSDFYTSISSRFQNKEPKVEKPQTWSLPYVTGQIYNIWWGTGIDFKHLSMSTTSLYTDSDDGVIFKFNYTLNR